MIVIVLGMHRSGTSVISGILHLNHILMGSSSTFKPKPLPQNPKGFYENFEFRKLNDQILNEVNYNVKSFNSNIPFPYPHKKTENKMENLIRNQIKKYNHWGWKDPRTCLTLDHWIDIILKFRNKKNIKVVFTIREPFSVANSLKNRDNIDFDAGIKLWSIYNNRALDFVQEYELDSFYFYYEDLILNPNLVVSKLFDFIDFEYDKNIITQFVDSKLNRSEKNKQLIDLEECRDLNKKFKNLSSV